MSGLLLAILFWLAGIGLLFCSYAITGRLRRFSEELLYDAAHEQGKDNSVSIARQIEGKILKFIPGYMIHMFVDVLGSLLIAFGFVALAFFFI
ncbi:MAG: hypothetical protein ABF820_01000 [Sporolactobacillus sp.]